jgi:hypothetical protein
MASEDRAYQAKVQEALAESSIKAEVSILTISEAINTLEAEKVGALMPLWKRYGLAILPAMLIDDGLALYCGVPTKERIVEAIAEYRKKGES